MDIEAQIETLRQSLESEQRRHPTGAIGSAIRKLDVVAALMHTHQSELAAARRLLGASAASDEQGE